MEFSPENKYIEYKEAKRSVPKDFWETYSAFANTSGGTVFLGVSEREKGVFEPTGVIDTQKVIVDMMTTIRSGKASVNLLTEDNVEVIDVEGRKIIKVYIPMAERTDKPVYLNDNQTRSFLRVDESDMPMDTTEFRYFVSEAGQAYDGDVLADYGLDDLNLKDVTEYQSIVADREGSEVIEKSIPDFLSSLGVYKIIRGSGNQQKYITTAGLLLFGKYNAITEKFPGFQLDYMQKESSTNPDYLDRIVTDNAEGAPENIFSFFQQIKRKLDANLLNPFSLDASGTQRTDFGVLFNRVIREALANALTHAYYKSSKSIQIQQFPDYIEFLNPGALRIGVEQFVHGGITDPRNPQIVTLFRRAGFAERGGTGGARIFDSVDKLQLKIPDVLSDKQETLLRIWKVDFAISRAEDLAQTSDERVIVDYLIQNNGASATKLKQLFTVESRYKRAMKQLRDKGVVTQFGRGRATGYQLVQTPSERKHQLNKMIRSFEDTLLKRD